jgi:fumarate hydratase class II
MPVICYNLINSITLLSDVTDSFNDNCVKGITPNLSRMKENLDKSLMLVTALSPEIGYENAAAVAKYAFKNDMTLKDAAVSLGFVTADRFDEIVDPSKMTEPK